MVGRLFGVDGVCAEQPIRYPRHEAVAGAHPPDLIWVMRDLLGLRTLAPVAGRSADRATWLRTWEPDGVRVVHFAGGPVHAYRTPADITHDHRDDYVVLIARDGVMVAATGESRRIVHAGDLLVLDAAQPFGVALGDNDPVEAVVIGVPRARLDGGRRDRPGGLPVTFAAASGPGRVLGPYFQAIVAPDWRSALTRRFFDTGLELLACALEHHLSAAHPTPRAMMLDRIRREARLRLRDCDLAPADVAAACAVSTRQLHRLFATEGTTFGAWVRDQRLSGSRRDLADPVLHDLAVSDIAARWGYRTTAHFSRSFRERYGVAPSVVRRRAQMGTASHRLTS